MERESEIFTEGAGADLTWLHLYTPDLASDELNEKAKEMLWNALLAL